MGSLCTVRPVFWLCANFIVCVPTVLLVVCQLIIPLLFLCSSFIRCLIVPYAVRPACKLSVVRLVCCLWANHLFIVCVFCPVWSNVCRPSCVLTLFSQLFHQMLYVLFAMCSVGEIILPLLYVLTVPELSWGTDCYLSCVYLPSCIPSLPCAINPMCCPNGVYPMCCVCIATVHVMVYVWRTTRALTYVPSVTCLYFVPTACVLTCLPFVPCVVFCTAS